MPFSYAARETPTPFVCRELMAVQSECCVLYIKSVNNEQKNDEQKDTEQQRIALPPSSNHRLSHTPVGNLILSRLLKWNAELMDKLVVANCKSVTKPLPNFPLLQQFVLKNNGIAIEDLKARLLLRQSLLGWISCRESLRAFKESMKKSAQTASNAAKEKSGKSDAETRNQRAVTEKTEAALLLPASCQRFASLKYPAKLGLEQQLLLALNRYKKTFAAILDHTKFETKIPDAEVVSSSSFGRLVQELKTLLIESEELASKQMGMRKRKFRDRQIGKNAKKASSAQNRKVSR